MLAESGVRSIDMGSSLREKMRTQMLEKWPSRDCARMQVTVAKMSFNLVVAQQQLILTGVQTQHRA